MKKQIEQELQESTALLGHAEKLANMGGWAMDLSTQHLSWSEGTFQLFGVSPEDFDNTLNGFLSRVLPEDRAIVGGAYGNLGPDSPPVEIEYRIQRKDGQIRWVYERGSAEFDTSGNQVRRIGMVMDISERKAAEHSLRASQSRYRAIVETSPDLILIIREDRITYVNPAGARLLRCDTQRILQCPLLDFVHPTGHPIIQACLSEAIIARQSVSPAVIARLVAADGTEIDAEVTAVFAQEEDGTEIQVCCRDVTARLSFEREREGLLAREQAARREADEASRYYRALFESSPGAYLVLTPDLFQILAVSDAYLSATMMKREQLVGRRLFEVFSEEILSREGTNGLSVSLERVRELRRADVMGVQRYPVPRPDEQGGGFEERFWSPINAPVFDAAGNVQYIIHRVEDVTGFVREMENQAGHTATYRMLAESTDRMQADIVLRSQELQRLNNQLIEQASLLRIATKMGRMGAWRVDLPNFAVTWSDEVCAIHEVPPGYSPSVETGIQFYVPEHRELIRSQFLRCLTEDIPIDLEAQIFTATGRRVWVRTLGEAARDESGQIRSLQGAFQDIDEFHNTKAAKEELRTQLAETLESITEGFFTIDRNWCFTYINSAGERFLHVRRDELLGKKLWDLYSDALGTKFESEYYRAMTEGIPVEFEEYYSGLESWFSVRAYPTNEGIAVYYTDITRKREDLERLRISEERFRLLSSATSDCIWDWDLTNDTVWWGEGLTRLFGFDRQESEPTLDSWYRRIHPEDLPGVLDGLHAAEQSGAEEWSDTYRFLRKDGSYAFVLDRGRYIRDGEGRTVRMIGGMTDLTGWKEAETRLAEQAELLDLASDAIIVGDLENRVTFWSRGAQALYGWSREEILGKPIQAILYEDPSGQVTANREVLESGRWTGELAHITKAGEKLTVLGRWTLLRDSSGAPKSILAINTDITERKKLEQQVFRVSRMESVGTLAGGIAHDFNNLLTPVLMASDLLLSRVANEDARKLIQSIQNSAQRGASLVRQLLGFVQGPNEERVLFSPGEVASEVGKIIGTTFPSHIQLEFEIAEDLWAVNGSATQIHQVLMNLCVNARDAMPEGGRLSVSLSNTVIDEAFARMHAFATPGPFVVMQVEDSGSGIPSESLERVFEPFFTTKEVGKGTGLGLSTVFTMVRKHGGFVNVESRISEGTRFKVYLPAVIATVMAEDQPIEQPPCPRGNGELILIVDDEENVREVTRNGLEEFGYRVVAAQHGAHALSVYVQHRKEIAAVLTDMSMPVMDGPALVVALKSLDPAVRIVGSTGMTASGHVAKAAAAGVRHFVPKPYTLEKILQTLHTVLTENTATGEKDRH